MLNFVAGLQSDLSPFLATILGSLGYKYSQFGYTKPKDNDEVNFQSSLLP